MQYISARTVKGFAILLDSIGLKRWTVKLCGMGVLLPCRVA